MEHGIDGLSVMLRKPVKYSYSDHSEESYEKELVYLLADAVKFDRVQEFKRYIIQLALFL